MGLLSPAWAGFGGYLTQMPEIENAHDEEMAARLRAEQPDPSVMYLVVREEAQVPFAKLAAAAAGAARRCVAEWADEPHWREPFADWFAGSFRKVAVRASEREWQVLKELDHVELGDVICLPPRLKSARERVLKRLQAYKGELDLPAFEAGPGLNLAVNAAVAMTAGKALAQLAHGALMQGGDAALEVHVGRVARDRWQQLVDDEEVAVVRDAGLTEIAAASETVLAFLRP